MVIRVSRTLRSRPPYNPGLRMSPGDPGCLMPIGMVRVRDLSKAKRWRSGPLGLPIGKHLSENEGTDRIIPMTGGLVK